MTLQEIQRTILVCANDLPYIWHGKSFLTSGIFSDTLAGSNGSCDTIATLQLNILPLITDTISVTLCANQLPYNWNGTNYTVAGNYADTLAGTNGSCDTIATLQLNILPHITDTISVTLCANQLPYNWNGTNYTVAGAYTDTLAGINGSCDTIATLQLNILPLITDTISVTLCTNQLPYYWNGTDYLSLIHI